MTSLVITSDIMVHNDNTTIIKKPDYNFIPNTDASAYHAVDCMGWKHLTFMLLFQGIATQYFFNFKGRQLSEHTATERHISSRHSDCFMPQAINNSSL